MKLIVSSFVCVSLLAGCERQPPTRPTPPRTAAAPAAPAPSAPAESIDAGAADEPPTRLPQTPEALAAYARIDAGVPSVDGGPRPITGRRGR
jgi:hypothetical protein